ncbi:MAG: hypothetical protein HZC36_02660 [Armatimonadetes bacterium]|nr:hypothetical protein [Armatimonadota bacterium]
MTITTSGTHKPLPWLDLLAIVFLFCIALASFLLSPVTMQSKWPPGHEVDVRFCMEWIILAGLAVGLWRSHESEEPGTRRLLGFLLVLGLICFVLPISGSAHSRAGVDWPEVVMGALICVVGGVYGRQRIFLFSSLGFLLTAIVYFFWLL